MKSLSITLDDALHVNDPTCYLSCCKSPLRYCLNTVALMILHVGGHNHVSGEGYTFFFIFIIKLVLLSLPNSIPVQETLN